MSTPAEPLSARAAAHGVATWYETAGRRRVDIDPAVVEAVLGLLGPRPAPRSRAGGAAALPEPPRTWGWMLQLYGVRSARSWGVGDFADLAAFTRWAASTGAGAILVNPLHAVAPVDPLPASPYSPSSRRFVNPLYLRIADLPEYRAAEPALRAQVDALRPAQSTAEGLIDYGGVWRAKRAALELLFDAGAASGTEPEPALRDFATYTALAEIHGADWRRWPGELRRPSPDAYAAAPAGRVAFHAWLQRRCAEQLAAADEAAAGMAVGIIQDLAVGIDPGGADAWTLQEVIVQGARIGAPPDAFNQQGQDWGLAAWRPDRLAASDYRAYRDLLREIFRHAGGLRVDHVAGLWRLWWVPPGRGAAEGTYVHYDDAAMLDILVEEAVRAGAVVVGEDLGTVEPVVTTTLRERNILGSAVLWFTRDAGGAFRPPAEWPANAVASISTHDLPTAAGFLAGEHVLARAAAGVLGRDAKDEWADAARERAALLDVLDAEGLTEPDSTDEEIVLAMHRLLERTPCRIVLASPYDVLGVVRQPNLPGTTDQYPNWRIPLPLYLDDLIGDARMRQIADLFDRR
ncbi:4-alpha-glucanotransferase [Dactylosporangium roseum]|uniref:4-alpha-glucanotransferase n=1 Tax=Dactylosporangium roseum TaxID=47989 RepID=UPI0021B29BD1|nr:4-alpha-glucanotransferase [Dactylosporangium roseum]